MTDWRDEHETYAHTESPIITRLQEEIARLAAERDDARRECCTWQGLESGRSKHVVAISRGWDYLRWPDPDALDRIARLDEENNQ